VAGILDGFSGPCAHFSFNTSRQKHPEVADGPHQTFSGAVLDPQDPALRHLDGLTGKRVGVKGVIRMYKGQAEILITSMGQIVIEP